MQDRKIHRQTEKTTPVFGFARAVFGKLGEFTRDVTGLGNPFILAVLGLVVFGFTQDYITLVLLWVGNEIFCSAIKFYYFRPRPDPMQHTNWLEKIEAGSFPSIHASRWAVFAVFALLQLPTGSLVSLLLLILTGFVGWTRIILKKHYLHDVLAGWVIGFVLAWVVGMLV